MEMYMFVKISMSFTKRMQDCLLPNVVDKKVQAAVCYALQNLCQIP